MKTHFVLIPVLISLYIGALNTCYSQEHQLPSSSPNTQYEVHREYDEDGNFIYYDSVAVSVWSPDTSLIVIDSLSDSWEYGVRNKYRPFYYGFRFPGDNFDFTPQFDFEFVIPDVYELFKGLEYNYSLSPPDTSRFPLFPDKPVFRHRHVVPPFDFDMDINEHIYRMEKFMEKFYKQMETYPDRPHFFNKPYTAPNDSTVNPSSAPKPFNNSYQNREIFI